VIIPARNRHKGWLEEKLSVAVIQRASEDDDTTKFLEADISSFMKDDKSTKQRYFLKNPKVQGEINAKVDELLQIRYIEHSTSPYNKPTTNP